MTGGPAPRGNVAREIQPEHEKADEASVADNYEPHGGDDLVPPDEDRPADGELGAGD